VVFLSHYHISLISNVSAAHFIQHYDHHQILSSYLLPMNWFTDIIYIPLPFSEITVNYKLFINY
jgi:hypothetical protein